MREVNLTNDNRKFLVDDKNFFRVATFKWFLNYHGNGLRIYCTLKENINVANFIMQKYGVLFDHKDRNIFNNTEANLREATHTQNFQNKVKQKSTWGQYTSKYKGVCWSKQHKCWRARITINKKRIELGLFKKEIDAARAYNVAAIKYFGEFACLNEIEEKATGG